MLVATSNAAWESITTPQGGVISPLLANIYLHDFDRAFHGKDGPAQFASARLVRYADDFVVLARWIGPRVVAWLEGTLEQELRLTVNRTKTRVVKMGGPRASLDFLGFTHMCRTTRKTGRFIVKRKTIRKRLSGKLGELKEELRRRWHQPVSEVGKWLRSVVQGYFNYHAVPGNMDSLNSFRAQVIWHWYRALRRRSQRDRMIWERFLSLVGRWIPSAKILHPHPNVRFDAMHPR